MRTGRPTDLAQVFREVLLRELPADIQIELSDRAARWHEERLGDPMGATPYLEKVLVLDPANERAFARLKDIFTGAERWGELEALYDRASEATLDSTRRTSMLAEVALVCEEITEEPAKATRYYERILEIDPLHEGALHALDRLYTQQRRYQDLARLLERRLETALGEEIFEFKLRLGRIQLSELLEPDRAILHVEDVLRERPSDHTARELAEKMLEIGSLRARAAQILEAVYEARDEIRDLVRVLGIRLEELDAELGARRGGRTRPSRRAPGALATHRHLARRTPARRRRGFCGPVAAGARRPAGRCGPGSDARDCPPARRPCARGRGADPGRQSGGYARVAGRDLDARGAPLSGPAGRSRPSRSDLPARARARRARCGAGIAGCAGSRAHLLRERSVGPAGRDVACAGATGTGFGHAQPVARPSGRVVSASAG